MSMTKLSGYLSFLPINKVIDQMRELLDLLKVPSLVLTKFFDVV